MANIYLSHRSLRDTQGIYDYSLEKWGLKRADKYLSDMQNSLKLLEGNPNLLILNPLISSYFKVYLSQKHWLICQTVKDDIYVLTIKHVSLNLLEKLKELQPILDKESKILSDRLKKN